ncbi:TetR/AcrR family transcriptional regulator [Pseudohaliea rubra]|uniref:Transcriptional regulator, TetR family n=1 Tax=Pseudohaliea rubra DSM 19751 TaxID=1265313 RepID=A0A095XUV7_9GAMM|nr:TetR/AcrR family transcriptional regulator [Pseudohaliea rubra]KGE03476.1 Transcriptional regulator, TetR family [Pseudohaliea rubra DSM 19751]
MPQPQPSRAEEGPLTQAERTALSDRRMFEAAIELINEFGTRKMTLKEIGERAGYSRGLASYRFGSKDGLLRELFGRFDMRWKEHLGERLQGKRGIEAIRAGIHAQRDFFRREPNYLRAMYLLWYESLGHESDIRSALSDHHAIYRKDARQWAEAGIADGDISSTIDPEQFAVRYCSFMFGTIYQWLVDADALDIDGLFADYEKQIMTILRTGV